MKEHLTTRYGRKLLKQPALNRDGVTASLIRVSPSVVVLDVQCMDDPNGLKARGTIIAAMIQAAHPGAPVADQIAAAAALINPEG